MFFLILLPLSLVAFVFFGGLWDWKEAFLYGFYCLMIACLLMEVVFFNSRKIPFACNSLPGRSRMHVLWIVYLLSFLAYVHLPVFLALELRKSIKGYLIFYAFVLVVLAAFRIYGKFLSEKATIIYEEEPEPVLITLDSGQY